MQSKNTKKVSKIIKKKDKYIWKLKKNSFGQKIISQNTISPFFLTLSDKPGKVVMSYKSGDYFGELALLKN
jgi:hypothetical protein